MSDLTKEQYTLNKFDAIIKLRKQELFLIKKLRGIFALGTSKYKKVSLKRHSDIVSTNIRISCIHTEMNTVIAQPFPEFRQGGVVGEKGKEEIIIK